MTNSQDVPIIAVASGKGGVGKTTVAVNLALALSARGARVGLIDADLYGPDVPRMMGLRRRKDTSSITVFARAGAPGAQLQPVERHGIQLVSAAFLMGEDQAIGVEAPVARLLVRHLFADSTWDKPDVLVVDLPPGTADIQQFVFAMRRRKVLVVIVVTPQVVAHQDVRRLIANLSGRRAQVVGGVENMSGFVCPHCGEISPLFPQAPEEDSIWSAIPKLASIPFSPVVAVSADRGEPVFVTREVPEQVTAYEQLADTLWRQISDEPEPSP